MGVGEEDGDFFHYESKFKNKKKKLFFFLGGGGGGGGARVSELVLQRLQI